MTDRTGNRPRRTRSLEERIAWLDAEAARVRLREERRLVRLARKAGYFDCRIATAELARLFEGFLGGGGFPPSQLARLEAQAARDRSRRSRASRAEDARRKAVLGAFLVAQFRHRPERLARLRPDIEEHLRSHSSDATAAANLAFMAGFLDGIASGAGRGSVPTGADEATAAQAARDRSRRQILLGAWLLDRRDSVPELGRLVREELKGFLDQDRRAGKRSAVLLADVIGAEGA